LIAGTTVGAGILALPAFTLPSGVVPSTVLLVVVWLYALVTALLIAEVNVRTMRRLGCANAGLLLMVAMTLGKPGARLAAGAYLFLHYALLVAYLAQGGEILATAIGFLFQRSLPVWVGTTLFACLFGSILYLGREKFVEKLNNAFVAIVILSFVGLLALGITQINPAQFVPQDWYAVPSAISVMFVALFFHNVIPVVTTQLEGDVQKIRRSIVIGSVIPLVMFLLWNAVILGSVNLELMQQISSTGAVFDPLQILRQGAAGEGLGVLVSIFSEFAIVTSFIGFVYGLVDFFKDLFKLSPGDDSDRLSVYSLILLPSMGLSSLNPAIFLAALDYAGAFSISILGGIIPAVLTWKYRYQTEDSEAAMTPFVPGGKFMLAGVIGGGVVVMVQHLLSLLA
jgi:tyrosine-specific transport protein